MNRSRLFYFDGLQSHGTASIPTARIKLQNITCGLPARAISAIGKSEDSGNAALAAAPSLRSTEVRAPPTSCGITWTRRKRAGASTTAVYGYPLRIEEAAHASAPVPLPVADDFPPDIILSESFATAENGIVPPPRQLFAP